jgi:hypothetical protein
MRAAAARPRPKAPPVTRALVAVARALAIACQNVLVDVKNYHKSMAL